MAARKRLTKVKRTQFLEALESSGTVSDAAKAIGVTRQSMYLVRESNNTFAEQWNDVVETRTDKLVKIGEDRAINGSDALLMFLLRSHRPDTYNPQPSQALTTPTSPDLNVIETARQVCLVLEIAKRRMDQDKAITVEVETVREADITNTVTDTGGYEVIKQ